MRNTSRTLTTPRIAVAAAISSAMLMVFAAPAWSTPTSFTSGDLVVDQVGTVGGATPTSTSAPVSLWDYSTAGVPSGYVVSLPTADSGTTHSLVESGTATYDGEITLSADGQYVYVTGYDDAPGVAKITSAASVPRTVGIVSSTGAVDTSTSLSDATTEGPPATPNNFRTATGTTGGASSFYTGGDGGLGVATDGASSASYLNSDTVHQVLINGTNLYESTKTGIVQVGSGLPTSGSPADAALIASPPAGFEPAGFAFATLGSGSTPDTLYVADTGNNAVEKYSYNGTTWVEKGSVSVPQVTGLAVSVTGGVANIYVTNATTTSAKYNSLLSGLTDSSGAGGTFTSSLTTLATAPTGESFKGVTFAPVAQPAQQTPEAPLVLLLPVAAGLIAAGGVALARRRRFSAA